MSIYKERAKLRSEGLKKILAELEKKRDLLLDELANKKGQAEQIEQTITRLYEIVLDINKEEQNREAEDLARAAREVSAAKEKEQKEKEKEDFDKAKRGVKTPKRERRE